MDVSFLLEIIPIRTEGAKEPFTREQLKAWASRMSSFGKKYYERQCLYGEDVKMLKDLYMTWVEHSSTEYFNDCRNIPSDSGKVGLCKTDYFLKSIVLIKKGEFITGIPYTGRKTILGGGDDNIEVTFQLRSGFIGKILKKPSPFNGFGGFVKWVDGKKEKANSKIVKTWILKEYGKSIMILELRAIEQIEPNQYITCRKTKEFHLVHLMEGIRDDKKELMEVIQDQIKKAPDYSNGFRRRTRQSMSDSLVDEDGGFTSYSFTSSDDDDFEEE